MPDATSVLNEISGALDAMATQAISMIGDDRSFMEIWGWNMPAMNRLEFADLIRSPRELILNIDTTNISDADFQRLQAIPQRIQYLRDQCLPNLPGGSAQNVYVVVGSLVQSLRAILERYAEAPLNLQAIEDKKLLPAQQLRTLRRYDAGIQRLGVESEELASKVSAINAAHEVAEALPADLQTLEDARRRYEAAKNELESIAKRAQASEASVDQIKTNLAAADEEARRVVERANAAYSAATTVGLGKAFAERAASLSRSTVFLGVVLVIALAIGATITYFRVQRVQALIAQPNIAFDILWLNVMLTALSVSAPVWLAWLVTRQIGQRFRLAEDYSYKATVARAYEGYRSEAAVIDQELVKKLFAIALDRVGEPPLRLVEKDSPGSPAHEVQGPVARFFSRRSRGGDGASGDD